jgi:uncharacterized membrane protein
MPKSDAVVYFFAVLLGICAGLLENRIEDFLVTAVFILASTTVLGWVRPQRPWRWMIAVATWVPFTELVAYLLRSQRPDRSQIWAAGFAFVAGTVGCFSGAFGRKGLNELLKKS